jgi:cytosine deaminase
MGILIPHYFSTYLLPFQDLSPMKLSKSTWQPFMIQAIRQAQIAASQGEIPVGALILDHSLNIISAQKNATRRLHDPSAHAEILAIRDACSKLKKKRLDNTTIIVTLEPCVMCAAAIAEAHCKRLVFGAYDTKAGAVIHGAQVFSMPHKPNVEIIGGIMEKENSLLIKSFFNPLRK